MNSHILPFHSYSRYEILSDRDKRDIYDARGEAGLSEQGGMGGMDPQVRFKKLLTFNILLKLNTLVIGSF